MDEKMSRRELLKIHGNCEWYCFKKSEPSQEGGCSNRGMADFSYLRLDPTGHACQYFESVER